VKSDRVLASFTSRRRPRAGARGAALAESVIVISTMLIFLGLIVWTRQAYGMKLDLQQRTRSDTLYFASHGCEDTGGGIGQPGGGGTVPGDTGPAEGAAAKTGLPDSAPVTRSWNDASASLNATVSWQAIWDQNANGSSAPINLQKKALVSNVSAGSQMTCNEKKYSSQLTAWFQFGLDFLKNGGGVMDLFRW
jgi:hypothetical protein